MKNVKHEALLWVQLGTFIAVWVILLYATNTPLKINLDAITKLPDVVTISVVLSFLFSRWLWRWNIFRHWLVPFPDLEGTWEGELKSKWKDPDTQQPLPAIPVILVIRQTFSSVSCALFTAESESYSTAAQVSLDEDSGALHLNYNYTNRPKALLRDRSSIHDGAARLKVISAPNQLLEGEFWTSRCTAGEISLRYRSRQLLESFSQTRTNG